MPKRTDIKSVLIIGSGPIVIGQACEFDYSGTQAVRSLKDEGYRVILVNSNPATIMTDPGLADRTYVEPLTVEFIEKIIAIEKPDVILPTMGGQTALNLAIELEERGILKKYNCELIGAKVDSIKLAEDREPFRQAMDEIGLESARSFLATNLEEARIAAEKIGYPLILRPSRTLGGTGGGVVNNASELDAKIDIALTASPVSEVLVEESLTGWKEIELEVMRDCKDNVVVVCTIENLDPMGVHTGDSITVAPIQTLTDKEYQALREAAKKVMRRIGVDTGGSNVQFAMNPKDGRIIVIEMNPRVSRSSALASKATGFAIAKISSKLAVGYSLDEIQNDITKMTPACFEPSIDYVVVKIPRFNFEKFPNADPTLGTQMKSVGEVMAIGRCFREALQKALCSLELDSAGFDRFYNKFAGAELLTHCARPTATRIWYVAEALRQGHSVEELHSVTGIDPWFLSEMLVIVQQEESLRKKSLADISTNKLLELKRWGFSDQRLADLLGATLYEVIARRKADGIIPSFKSVDTCAGEFPASTPYLYSTYEQGESDVLPDNRQKVIILGSGPNRIGQGIEFDYCCVHAVEALRADGYEAIMINCNPETVSTDYDISDRLYFEPLTFEHVMAVIDREKPLGVIVQFGGQTPLKLAEALQNAGVRILGTSVDSIDLAEDRERFTTLITDLGLKQPRFALARSMNEALSVALEIGFPLMIRPSFVLGGRAMRIVFDQQELREYINDSVSCSSERPVLLDRYLHNAIELDVDVVSDGNEVVVAGVMEHIERAGIHSGDSSCCLPPVTLRAEVIEEIKIQAVKLAKALKVVGLMNAQFAVSPQNTIYVLEVNPRASRTVPFVSKATGTPWAKVAARLMAGKTIAELGIKEVFIRNFRAIKACVFPFAKFPGVDSVLGPEMKSTGEVMGIGPSFSDAFVRSQYSVGTRLPTAGKVFLSVKNDDKTSLPELIESLVDLGFSLVATGGTANYVRSLGYNCEAILKVWEGTPNIVDAIDQGKINLVINTPEGYATLLDSRFIRFAASKNKIPTYTTMAAALAAVKAIQRLRRTDPLAVRALQDYHAELSGEVDLAMAAHH